MRRSRCRHLQKSQVAAQPRLRGAIQAGVPVPGPDGEAQREQGGTARSFYERTERILLGPKLRSGVLSILPPPPSVGAAAGGWFSFPSFVPAMPSRILGRWS